MKTILKTYYCRIETPDFIQRLDYLDSLTSQITDIRKTRIDYASSILEIDCEHFASTTSLREQLLNQGIRISRPLNRIRSYYSVSELNSKETQEKLRQTLEKNVHIKRYRLLPRKHLLIAEYDSTESPVAILQTLETAGIKAQLKHHVRPSRLDKNLDLATVFSGLLIILAYMFTQMASPPVTLPVEYLWTASILLNTWSIMHSGFTLRARNLAINSGGFILFATLLALYFDLWMEAALAGFMYGAIKTLERYYWTRIRYQFARLFANRPQCARVVQADSSTKLIPVTEVQPGDRLNVRRGETVPVDGEVFSGVATAYSSIIQGSEEKTPVRAGIATYSGIQVDDGDIELICSRTYADSASTLLFNDIETSIHDSPPALSRTQQIARWFKWLMILTAAITLGATLHPTHGFQPQWLTATLALLIVAQSSASLFAMQLAYTGSISLLGKLGIKVNSGKHWQLLDRSRKAFIDVTDVLTANTPEAQEIVTFGSLSTSESLDIAATIAWHANQASPDASWQAIISRFNESDTEYLKNAHIKEVFEDGVEAEVEGQRYWLGNYRFNVANGLNSHDLESRLKTWEQEDKQGIILSQENTPVAIILVRDPARPYAGELRDFLVAAGIRDNTLLSGANPNTGELFQEQYEYTHAELDLSVSQKVAYLQAAESEQKDTLLISNDATLLDSWQGGKASIFSLIDTDRLRYSNIACLNHNSSRIPVAIDLIRHQSRSIYSTILCYAAVKLALVSMIMMHSVNIQGVVMVELLLALSSLHLCSRYLHPTRLLKLPETAIRSRDMLKIPSRPRSLMR